ncbi:MAG: transcriptional repressor [Nitrospirae bacterium GWD2_57_9]|nr:MAG: transcriptional repressor [Nitrospirae bacterium GWD2_57_9]OGW45802.1 MAG: transcriptional repressor [Nitrospirae bacterium GWC2_57_9]
MERYRDRGLKLTPQRIAIFDYLEGNKAHPSADEIYKAVAKKFPTMSFATVYNTLTAMKDRGAIREVTIDPSRKRYDPDTMNHNHLICIGCKRVFDVPRTYDLELPARLRNEFTVLANHVEFRGLCPECRKRKP